jgi:hypothetical protein|tara:strand:+ start:178 stop:342 length:165 start_codon:yes stop_codon:yes gene_type:complete
MENTMSKVIITDADAAVCAIDYFTSFCLSFSEGNIAQAAFDFIGLAAAIKNSIS